MTWVAVIAVLIGHHRHKLSRLLDVLAKRPPVTRTQAPLPNFAYRSAMISSASMRARSNLRSRNTSAMSLCACLRMVFPSSTLSSPLSISLLKRWLVRYPLTVVIASVDSCEPFGIIFLPCCEQKGRSEHTWTDTHQARRALFEAEVRAALRSEPRLGPSFHLKALGIEPDGSLVLDGEVPTIAAKKMALEKVAAIPGIIGIVGRLHVEPATRMGDGEIRVHVRHSLIEEPAFQRLESANALVANSSSFATFPKGHAALSTSKFRKGLSF